MVHPDDEPEIVEGVNGVPVLEDHVDSVISEIVTDARAGTAVINGIQSPARTDKTSPRLTRLFLRYSDFSASGLTS